MNIYKFTFVEIMLLKYLANIETQLNCFPSMLTFNLKKFQTYPSIQAILDKHEFRILYVCFQNISVPTCAPILVWYRGKFLYAWSEHKMKQSFYKYLHPGNDQ